MKERSRPHVSVDRPPGEWTRRELVVVALSALGAVAAGACDATAPPHPRPSRRSELPPSILDLQEVLDAYFAHGDRSDLQAVGLIYAERFPDDTALTADLAIAIGIISGIDDMDAAVRALETAVRNDFAMEQRINLAGWQLSITETRLCGIIGFLS